MGMRNLNRIRDTFKRLKKQNKKAFIPYIMAGDGGLEKTKERVLLLEKCGADIVELGVPFSDPLADGPTIQRAAERALKSGITLKKVMPFVKELRQYTQIPIVLMTYYNPIFKYGEERFVKDALEAGVDGIIIPDLPPEEADSIIKLCRLNKKDRILNTIFLVAPTSTEKRIKKIASACTGFVYYVSITGITGSRLNLEETFRSHIDTVKRLTDKPVVVGFGVSTPDDAQFMARVADGVIIGSAIVKKFFEQPDDAEDFIKKLREAI
jgi:tryptophan synthase alpha chain